MNVITEIIVRMENRDAYKSGLKKQQKEKAQKNKNANNNNANDGNKNLTTEYEYEVKCQETWAWYPANIVGFDKEKLKFRVKFENEFSTLFCFV